MTDIIIRGALANELQALAQEQQVSVEELIQKAIAPLSSGTPVKGAINRAALLQMAKNAEEAGVRIGRDDVSEHFGEILNQLVAEELHRRKDDSSAE